MDDCSPGLHITFRLATRDDAPALAALLDQLGYPSHLEAVRERLARIAETPNYEVWLAETPDGTPVGMAALFIFPVIEADGLFARLMALVVDEAHRDQSIGHALVAHVEQVARARGCVDLHLTCNKRRLRAHDFYRRLGFVDRSYKFDKPL